MLCACLVYSRDADHIVNEQDLLGASAIRNVGRTGLWSRFVAAEKRNENYFKIKIFARTKSERCMTISP